MDYAGGKVEYITITVLFVSVGIINRKIYSDINLAGARELKI